MNWLARRAQLRAALAAAGVSAEPLVAQAVALAAFWTRDQQPLLVQVDVAHRFPTTSRTFIAALCPGIPLTAPPRCAADPHRKTFSWVVSTPHVPTCSWLR